MNIFRRHTRLIVGLAALVVGMMVGVAGLSFRNQTPAGASITRPPVHMQDVGISNTDPSAALNYWTPDRLKSAVPDTPPAVPLPDPGLSGPLPDGPPSWLNPVMPSATPMP